MDNAWSLLWRDTKRLTLGYPTTPSRNCFAGRNQQTHRAGSFPSLIVYVKSQYRQWSRPFHYQLVKNDMDVDTTTKKERLDEERAGTSKDLLKPQKKIRKPLVLAALVTLILILSTEMDSFLLRVLNCYSAVLTLAVHFALIRSRNKQQPPSHPGVPYGGNSTSSPIRPMTPTINGPVITSNFADPCFIDVNGTYYAFATNKYIKPGPGQVHIQLATSSDFQTWDLTGQDALPDVGGWATGAFVWAPDVIQLVGLFRKSSEHS